MRLNTLASLVILAALTASAPALAQQAEDAGALAPAFQEGDVITFDLVDKLRPYLPDEFWDNRDFFFYEGMQLEIGPTQFDYSPNDQTKAATERFRGQPRIGPDNSLENWIAGYPFPQETIDCAGDPQAGVKIMWDFTALRGDGHAHFFYSYWDRGEQLPLYYEGTGQTVSLAHRIEPEYLDKSNGDLFRGEKRKFAFGVDVTAPFDARGIQLLSYRYKASGSTCRRCGASAGSPRPSAPTPSLAPTSPSTTSAASTASSRSTSGSASPSARSSRP